MSGGIILESTERKEYLHLKKYSKLTIFKNKYLFMCTHAHTHTITYCKLICMKALPPNPVSSFY